jgi:hypothetical protein
VQPLCESIGRFFKKLKIELPYDSSIPLLGIYLKECKSAHNRNICTLTFIEAPFIIAKLWNQPRCSSTDEKIKENVRLHTYTHTMDYY